MCKAKYLVSMTSAILSQFEPSIATQLWERCMQEILGHVILNAILGKALNSSPSLLSFPTQELLERSFERGYAVQGSGRPMTPCPVAQLDHGVGNTGSFTRMYMSAARCHSGNSHRHSWGCTSNVREKTSEGLAVRRLNR